MRFSQDLLELRTGVREIRITLEPESLGELTISVMKTDAGVSARIFSPDRDVCSAVADKLPVLLQSIEQNGLTMQELEIIHAPADFAGNAAQTGQSGRQGGRRGQTFRAVASAAARDDESAFWSGFHQSGRPDDATVVYRV
jgi:flagellar hook-length control protein FliK